MYTLREVVLKNGPHERKSLVIDFTDPNMDVVGEFLMTDASLLNYEVLRLIDHVLSRHKIEERISGNRCSLTITAAYTRIEDLFVDMFEDVQTYPTYDIETTLLKNLIHMWKKEKQYRN